MPWKEVTSEELAKTLGINIVEVREKRRLIKLIVEARKEKGSILRRDYGIAMQVPF